MFIQDHANAIQISHRFAPMVISGRKKQQIVRTLKIVPDDTILLALNEIPAKESGLDLWMEKCITVQSIKFSHIGIYLDGARLIPAAADHFAHGEGFIDFQELLDWYFAYNQTDEFEGFVIYW